MQMVWLGYLLLQSFVLTTHQINIKCLDNKDKSNFSTSSYWMENHFNFESKSGVLCRQAA